MIQWTGQRLTVLKAGLYSGHWGLFTGHSAVNLTVGCLSLVLGDPIIIKLKRKTGKRTHCFKILTEWFQDLHKVLNNTTKVFMKNFS